MFEDMGVLIATLWKAQPKKAVPVKGGLEKRNPDPKRHKGAASHSK